MSSVVLFIYKYNNGVNLENGSTGWRRGTNRHRAADPRDRRGPRRMDRRAVESVVVDSATARRPSPPARRSVGRTAQVLEMMRNPA